MDLRTREVLELHVDKLCDFITSINQIKNLISLLFWCASRCDHCESRDECVVWLLE